MWISVSGSPQQRFCYGTGLGWLIIVEESLDEVNSLLCELYRSSPTPSSQKPVYDEVASLRLHGGHEVTCMAKLGPDAGLVRLATGSRDCMVQVWTLDALNQLKSVFAVRLDTTVPRGITFIEGPGLDLVIFGYLDGML